MTAVAALLEVRNLNIRFPRPGARKGANSGPKSEANAVRDLSFAIAPGEVLGLVGESGSGKSVTSLAIMGLLPGSAEVSGQITFRNGDLKPYSLLTLSPDLLRDLRGSRIAMI